jgi:uncharacterized membrane protein
MLREWLSLLTDISIPLIDFMALAVILVGSAEAFLNGVRVMLRNDDEGLHAVRSVWLRYSRWLIAGLTFQLAADIIETAVAPTWDDIGRLGAIAVIRTVLSYFLERDQNEVRELQKDRG